MTAQHNVDALLDAYADHGRTIARVRAELDRLAELDVVSADSVRADSFAAGARWAIRMVRENALDGIPKERP